jgi:16S rRNA (uracil1498-N3)-methyltransferase
VRPSTGPDRAGDDPSVSTAPLFLVDRLPGGTGTTVVLDGPEGRHAATVRRIRAGEAVQLGDGRGGLARAAVEEVARDVLTLRVTDLSTVAPPALRVVLAQALVKGDRGELAVELATEAGVDAVVPWRAARCVARWEAGARGEKAWQRWRATARAAAKQARRAWVPEVEPAVTTGELVRRVRRADAALVLHEGAPDGLVERAAAGALPAAGELVLVVGPEGGLTDPELAELSAAGAWPVRLGAEVLRASTAAAVALGALGALTGRWGGRPDRGASDRPMSPPTSASSG